jgi:hypothetical protein
MRIIRNERHIRTRSFIGRYATLAGLLVLLASLVISFAKPEWVLLMLACVTLGIIFWATSPTATPARWPITTR